MFTYFKNRLLAKGIFFIYKNYNSFLYITNLFKKDKKTPSTTINNNPVSSYPLITSEEIK